MDIDSSTSSPQPYTILRIKRKRGEEPLDALVVETLPSRKRGRGAVGIFQFAQTVEKDAWQDEKQTRDIEEQISRLSREPNALPESKATHISQPEPIRSPVIQQTKDQYNRRYTIIAPPSAEETFRKVESRPPKVLATRDIPIQASRSDFRMYDAILNSEAKSKKTEVDEEVDKFIPMLTDYLKLHDLLPKPAGADALSNSPRTDDYVYDVFYHRPVASNELNSKTKVGTITGPLPAELDPYDSFSDSEEEDEADEDSNAEEYYKNDYPDEVSSGSDEPHESSEYDNIFGNEDNDENIEFP